MISKINDQTKQVITALLSHIDKAKDKSETIAGASILLGAATMGILGLATGGSVLAYGVVGAGIGSFPHLSDIRAPGFRTAMVGFQNGLETANGQFLSPRQVYHLFEGIRMHLASRNSYLGLEFDPNYDKHVHELIDYMDKNGHDDALKSLLLLGAHPDDMPKRIVEAIQANLEAHFNQDNNTNHVTQVIEKLDELRHDTNSLFYNFSQKDVLYSMLEQPARTYAKETLENQKPKIEVRARP